jgi:Transglutaminase-like superfamily
MRPSAHDYYRSPGRFTCLDQADQVAVASASLEVSRIVEIVQGLLIYDLFAKPFYGVDLSTAQADAIHERDTARLLSVVRTVDPRTLFEPRAPANRVGARCHVFSRLTVAILRAAGIPARARCGFGTYFKPGWFEDHWVAEYWDTTASKWVMADAQLDAKWCQVIGFHGDPMDVTPQEFVTAGHAWQAWRRGELNEKRCGLSAINESGTQWIAGNLRLDLASLNKVEMLPWDVWGAGWAPGQKPTEDQLRLFDEVAELTVDPDLRFNDLRDRYESDDALRLDGTVFNVLRGQLETI